MRYRFGAFEYDTAAARLTRGDDVLTAQPIVLEALALFLGRPGELVRRDDLVEALWPGTHVTDNSLAQVITRLRRTLGDERPHTYVETVRGLGYRFMAGVVEQMHTPAARPAPA